MSQNTQSLAERLMSSYKQAFQLYVMGFLYSIIAIIVLLIGFTMGGDAIIAIFLGDSSAIAGAILGILVVFIGLFLLITSGFSALIYAATRGGMIEEPLGFLDTYKVTIKLIGELGVALVAALVFLIIGAQIGGGLGVILLFLATVLFGFFPIAALFYVINYLIGLKGT